MGSSASPLPAWPARQRLRRGATGVKHPPGFCVVTLSRSLGSSLYHRFAARKNSQRLLTDLLAATATATLLGILMLPHAPRVYEMCRTLGDDPFHVLLAETAVASMIFALPTLAMGAMFSHLVQ